MMGWMRNLLSILQPQYYLVLMRTSSQRTLQLALHPCVSKAENLYHDAMPCLSC